MFPGGPSHSRIDWVLKMVLQQHIRKMGVGMENALKLSLVMKSTSIHRIDPAQKRIKNSRREESILF